MNYKKLIIFVFITSLMIVVKTALGMSPLMDMHVSNHASTSEMVFSVNLPIKAHVFLLPNPERLVVDFEGGRFAVHPKILHMKTALINHVRSGSPKVNTMRLVFDLNAPVSFRSSVIAPGKLMVELTRQGDVLTQDIEQSIDRDKMRPITVVIDPGHGGKDSGAVGPSGIKEKDVVLSIAKQLAILVNQQSNMRAVLTRDSDYFVSLHDRLVRARRGKADLFVAIHADSYFNKNANGASIYALSQHGATSIAARWLAQRENYSELGGVDLGDLEDQSYLLRSVLIDLAQTTTSRDSMRLGGSLLDALDSVVKLHYTRVEQAPFMVLKSPDIPSILVETGFISNIKEEKRLRDKYYQHKIAMALLDGIMTYQKKYAQVSMS